MDSLEESCGVDMDSNRTRKYGLPGWMTTNMERLNYSTDFEQYASSPPEGEGFLAQHYEGMKNLTHIQETTHPSSDSSHGVLPHTGPEQTAFPHTGPNHSMRWRSLINDPEDHYSSPDSTPCATPEPSPVIRRKVSIPHPDDTILTNPGRWFYMGKLKKTDCNNLTDKENKRITMSSDGTDGNVKPIKKGIKLVISNFDLNAVSPNSW